VESIYLEKNCLSGKLPTEIFKCPFLKEINLGGNKIKVSFRGIKNEYLRELNLDSTGLDSVIGISKAEALASLHLRSNSFTGKIPDELLSLTTLEELDISDNSFSDEIPAGLRTLTSLKSFSAFNNELSCYIPSWISSLSKLEYLHLDQNDFFGSYTGSSLSSLAFQPDLLR